MSNGSTNHLKRFASFSERFKRVSLDEAASLVFFIGVVLFPLVFFPIAEFLIDIQKTLFLLAVIVLSFLLWLLSRLKSGHVSFPLHPLFASGGAVVLVFIASALFSPAARTSFYGFSYEIGTVIAITALFLLMFLSALFFESSKRLTRFYQALLVVFGVVFLFQMIRLIFNVDILSFGGFLNGKIGNVIGKWNDLGIFSGFITLLSLITLESVSLSRRARVLMYIALVASLILLGIVNFYLLWIIIGLFSLVVFVYNFSFSRFGKREVGEARPPFPIPSFVVLLISFLFLIGGSTIGAAVSEKLSISQIEVRPAWSSTLSVLKETIKENPLLGSGPNRFSSQWLLFKPEGINNTFFWNAEFHSGVGLLPTFATTTGVIGSVAWIVFFGLFFFYGAKFLFSGQSFRKQYALFSAFTLATYFWVVSFFYVPTITMFAFAFLMTGVFLGVAGSEGKVRRYSFSYFENPHVGFASVLILAILIMGTVAGGYSLTKKFFALKNFYTARVAFASSGDLEKAESYIVRAKNQDTSDAYERALAEIKTRQIALLLSRQDLSPEAARSQFQRLLGEAITAGQAAVQFDNTNNGNWLTLARVYASVVPFVNGAYESARVSLSEAFARNPKSPLILLEEARLEIANQNGSEARRYMSEALALKPDYAQAIFALAQLDLAEGNAPQAIERLEETALLLPNDAGVFFQLGLLKYNTGNFEGAVSAFERAISIQPEFANAKYFLGLSYANVRRTSEAVAQFEELSRINPDNAEVKQILTNLRAGRTSFTDSSVERDTPPFEE